VTQPPETSRGPAPEDPAEDPAGDPAEPDDPLADPALQKRIEQDRDDFMRPAWLERWRLRIARNRPLEAFYRAVVLVVGLAIVVAGVVMLVFPGPGWAAIILGLLVLATEYRWAERLLDPVQQFVRWLARRATDPKARAENIVFLLVVAAVVALAVWWYVARYGWTLSPLPFFG
jgi:uncharacterized protein (TIGR02611 family)